MLNEVDIDFRIPGLPHSVLKQAENYRVRELVKKIENHPHRQALQRDLQQNNAYNPFSEKPKKIIKDMGNVELFDLFETDPETQCKECLSYWSQGIVYCTCGHLLKESEASRGAIQCTLDILPIPNYVIKKGRPHGHRYGKTPQQKEYHQAHNLKKRCIKKNFKGSTIAFWEILNSVHPCSNMIEMMMSVPKWTSLRTIIAPITWRKQNIFDTNRIVGSLSISLETLDHWEIILTSTKRCLHQSVHIKNLENDNSGRCHSGSTRNGTNHPVLPPVGGNGVDPGGLKNSKKVDERGCMQRFMIERRNTLCSIFG